MIRFCFKLVSCAIGLFSSISPPSIGILLALSFESSLMESQKRRLFPEILTVGSSSAISSISAFINICEEKTNDYCQFRENFEKIKLYKHFDDILSRTIYTSHETQRIPVA